MRTKGISEKAFTAIDAEMKEINSFASMPEVVEIIERFEADKYREEFCAESLFSRIM